MSLYRREMDEIVVEVDTGEHPYPRSLVDSIDAAREWREAHSLHVTCATCGRRERLGIHYGDQCARQIRLWRQGWRRVPETQLDYCPAHVPEVVH